mmetsp:Transcript_40473/g.114628  ORF Transcript_40473/g.114628 Transcript_40473/m.114628 type:complete len:216 (+) Transcript_40473:177-824(+)
MQPIDIPIMAPAVRTLCVIGSASCAAVSSGSFANRCECFAMTSCNDSPAMSDIKFPRPAAHIEEMVSVAPSAASMLSPAVIIMKLSRKPNPTKGMPWLMARSQRAFEDGGSTVSSIVCWLGCMCSGMPVSSMDISIMLPTVSRHMTGSSGRGEFLSASALARAWARNIRSFLSSAVTRAFTVTSRSSPARRSAMLLARISGRRSLRPGFGPHGKG